MLLLALDTATDGVAVAVHDGQRVLAAARAGTARSHNEVLVPTVAQVLRAAGRERRDVTDVAVGVGPGPFTGLRVGIATARTLALAWGTRVHGVCSLDALAAAALAAGRTGEFLVATDARRREVHTARYVADGDGVRRTAGPDVLRPADVFGDGGADVPVVGSGTRLYPDALGGEQGPFDVDGGALAQVVVDALAGRPGPELLPPEPLYLRRPDATAPGARKRVTA
ncbi:tRNA (adenosine(37)-N6)-threonylcarbamoyltransferase complex dimerization subunit type 1 TsaB [Kineococcus sp. LSe6-4]|uniref:tRNA (Adenosine(37)-N6)-threonylcarbamoyltransferase complex dimerization subunit type 1 TsaB n=1 Tax=Kineococcus halophytocola TaxID=3234027 RepID=A0ABV4H140_9ACTN